MSGRGSRLVFQAYGRVVEVVGPTAALGVARERLPPTYVPSHRKADRSWRVETVDAAEHVISELELWVADHARGAVFIHAGCVAVDDRAILLPGRSMSGKSALTAALVRAGATYFSDEYAVLDSRGWVRPYARPLSVRPYDGGPPRRVEVAELGDVGSTPVPVGAILFLQYDPIGWDVVDVPQALAVLRLIDNAVAAKRRPSAVLNASDLATTNACALAGNRGDADEAAAAIMQAMRSK